MEPVGGFSAGIGRMSTNRVSSRHGRLIKNDC